LAGGADADNEEAATTAAKDKQVMLITRRADGIATSFCETTKDMSVI
jgi:hypothetical protein